MKKIAYSLALLLILPSLALAEEIDQIFKKVNEFIAQQNFSKALEELQWAEKEITKLHTQKIQSFIPAQLDGFQGGAVEANAALGMTNLAREYQKDGKLVSLSLTGGNMGGMAGGLAGLGKMAAMMGQQAGQESFRVDGQTASLTNDGYQSELQVFLDSGSILSLTSSDLGNDAASTLKKMAQELKLGALDSYLKGSAS